MKKQATLGNLIGTWQIEGADSRAIIEISEKRGKPHVSVFDKVDGEKFKVTKLTFQNGILEFEAYVPSIGYRTRHLIKAKGRDMIVQEFTVFEKWFRVDPITGPQ